MKVNNKLYRSIWVEDAVVCMIEQNLLPFEFKIHRCYNMDETCHAIKTMITRGAGSIGAAGGYAMLQAIWENKNAENLYDELKTAKQQSHLIWSVGMRCMIFTLLPRNMISRNGWPKGRFPSGI